jgi:hypothetical protein
MAGAHPGCSERGFRTVADQLRRPRDIRHVLRRGGVNETWA